MAILKQYLNGDEDSSEKYDFHINHLSDSQLIAKGKATTRRILSWSPIGRQWRTYG